MANLQERRNKDGKLISYSIRIFRGRGPDGKQLNSSSLSPLPSRSSRPGVRRAPAKKRRPMPPPWKRK